LPAFVRLRRDKPASADYGATRRAQSAGLKSSIDALPTLSKVDLEIGNKSWNNTGRVATLVQTISKPPNQAQVQAIQNKFNELTKASGKPQPEELIRHPWRTDRERKLVGAR
jgi:hypothetical protein